MSESGRREGSVSTSLAELVKLEDERLQRERAEAEERLRVAARARAAAEEAARRAEEERRAAEAASQAEKERFAREEAARIQALQQATLEEARQRLRLEESAIEHQRSIEALRAQTPLPPATRASSAAVAAGALVGALVAVAACAGVYVGSLAPSAEEARAEAIARLDDKRAEATAADRRASSAELRARELDRDLQAARGDVKRLQDELDALKRARVGAPAPTAAAPTAPRTVKVDPRCQNPGDPLCPQISGGR